ncbi:MAG: HAMP domain-containing histidine kinase [Gammaproteobacteria bacterium]|nr:HAMP domain-containing histidine kinase [Gammaproteobacteria bacterium]
MSQGLPRKLRIAFIVQVLMAGFAIVLGAYVSTVAVERELSKRSLLEEAAYFWQRHAADPAHVAPRSRILDGYMVPPGASAAPVPELLRNLPPGFHMLKDQSLLLLVDDRAEGRLYLTYSQAWLDRMALLIMALPVLLALLAVIASSLYTYRIAKGLVTPVNWLARQVGRWDPREPDVSMLAPDRLPPESDIETRQLAGALQRMAERVRAFVARERDFTRDSSHELRTPLTVIRVATDLMLGDNELPERVQRSLLRIQRAGRDMEAVIDAFLILAREADMGAHFEDFAVLDVVHEELDKIRPSCGNKKLDVRVIEDAHPLLHAPPRVLGVMLGNLLSNACTFTDSGHVEVRVAADRIVIRDSGIGMDEDTIARAFDPFYRADFSDGISKGMGLSIVRRLGERFGWPVTLESTPGQGTTATIRFAA